MLRNIYNSFCKDGETKSLTVLLPFILPFMPPSVYSYQYILWIHFYLLEINFHGFCWYLWTTNLNVQQVTNFILACMKKLTKPQNQISMKSVFIKPETTITQRLVTSCTDQSNCKYFCVIDNVRVTWSDEFDKMEKSAIFDWWRKIIN